VGIPVEEAKPENNPLAVDPTTDPAALPTTLKPCPTMVVTGGVVAMMDVGLDGQLQTSLSLS
jgi:hypothetical protein